MGQYLYAVIRTEQPQPVEPLGLGVCEAPLGTVHWQDIACVVSDSRLDNYPVSREHTMAHHGAIEAVWKQCPALLPVCFNTIATSEEAIIEQVLKPRREEFLELLDWVADKEEVTVKAYWRMMEPVFQTIGEKHPEIRTLRDELAQRPPAARYYGQIELGKLVEAALKAHREEERKRMVESFQAFAVDVRCDPVYGDRWILNAACLLEKSKVQPFRQELQRWETLSGPLGDHVVITSGPGGPPFHFVEVHITWKEESRVSH